MKFIIGEGLGNQLERLEYRGSIGLFYTDTLGGVLCYIVFGLLCILAVIGLFTVGKWLIHLIAGMRHRNESAYEKWERERKKK